MKGFFTLLLSITVSTFCVSQSNADNDCKAQLTIDPQIENVEKLHYIFTGADTTGLDVKVTKITVVEGRRALVKRRKSSDCVSPNPEDCLEEVLEEIPPVTMNLYTLPGPDKTKEYDTRTENVRLVKKEGGKVETSIVCPKNRSSQLISKVQLSLIELGYPLTANGILDQATKLSITDLQQSKGLAYGDLTLEILAVLDVK